MTTWRNRPSRGRPEAPCCRGTAALKGDADQQAHGVAFVPLEFEVPVSIRFASVVAAKDLRHEAQCSPPFLLAIVHDRPHVDGSIFPTFVFGNLVMITHFDAD